MDHFERFRSRQQAELARARACVARTCAAAVKARVVEIVARSRDLEGRSKRALSVSAVTIARTRDRLGR